MDTPTLQLAEGVSFIESSRFHIDNKTNTMVEGTKALHMTAKDSPNIPLNRLALLQ